MAKHLPAVLEETGHSLRAIEERFGLPLSTAPIPTDSSQGSGLTLEHHTQIANLDRDEWNALLADRGAFDADSLAMLEATHNGTSDADCWRFHYYVVRDAEKKPILATFFTDAIWKNDVFSAAEVSRAIEEERLQDPSYQTSRVFSMGSLLTEGNHLYIDSQSQWRVALNMLLQAVRAEAKRAKANTVIFRELSESQGDVGQYLQNEGFARSPLPNSMHIELGGNEETWLANLSSRQRHFIRKEVYPRRDDWVVRIVDAENPTDAATHDHLFRLYENVKNKSLRLNSFFDSREFLESDERNSGLGAYPALSQRPCNRAGEHHARCLWSLPEGRIPLPAAACWSRLQLCEDARCVSPAPLPDGDARSRFRTFAHPYGYGCRARETARGCQASVGGDVFSDGRRLRDGRARQYDCARESHRPRQGRKAQCPRDACGCST